MRGLEGAGRGERRRAGEHRCRGRVRGLPATSVLVPLLDLTENRGTSIKAEVYPQMAANKARSVCADDRRQGCPDIGSPNAETALVKGIGRGNAIQVVLQRAWVTTYNPASSVTVRRVRLESWSL